MIGLCLTTEMKTLSPMLLWNKILRPVTATLIVVTRPYCETHDYIGWTWPESEYQDTLEFQLPLRDRPFGHSLPPLISNGSPCTVRRLYRAPRLD